MVRGIGDQHRLAEQLGAGLMPGLRLIHIETAECESSPWTSYHQPGGGHSGFHPPFPRTSERPLSGEACSDRHRSTYHHYPRHPGRTPFRAARSPPAYPAAMSADVSGCADCSGMQDALKCGLSRLSVGMVARTGVSWGAGGRPFESARPDSQITLRSNTSWSSEVSPIHSPRLLVDIYRGRASGPVPCGPEIGTMPLLGAPTTVQRRNRVTSEFGPPRRETLISAGRRFGSSSCNAIRRCPSVLPVGIL
jgi:hypothetical protein